MEFIMTYSGNLFTAIVCTLGVIIMLIPPNFAIRNWVFLSAFDGMSKSDKKKLKENHTIWQRILLLYTIGYDHSPKTKRRVICYLVWWFISILMASMFFLREYNTVSDVVLKFFYAPKLVFDVIISVFGLNWLEYKDKANRK